MFVQPGPPCEAEVAETTGQENNGRAGLQKGNMRIEATEGGKTLNMGASRAGLD